MTNDPANPYGAAEMQMHERMTAATGANASETWVRKMIVHHQGAVAMSDVLLAQGGDQRFLGMARKGSDMQRKEIAELERLLAGGVTGSGPANPYAPVESSMHDKMMAARGSDAAHTWARKMIAHHQGAIDMSDVLIAQGGDPKVVALAKRTSDMQRKEIKDLETLLAGGTVGARTEMPPAKAVAAPAAKTPATTPARAARETPAKAASPAPAKPVPKEEPAADPHAGHDMSKM